MAKPTATSHVLTDEDRYITKQEAEKLACGEPLPSDNERLLVYCRKTKQTYWMRLSRAGYKLRPSPMQSSMLHGARSGIDHFIPLYRKEPTPEPLTQDNPQLITPLAKRLRPYTRRNAR